MCLIKTGSGIIEVAGNRIEKEQLMLSHLCIFAVKEVPLKRCII
jgi:hypothetical protein